MHGIGERYNLWSHIWKKSLWKVLFQGIESQEIFVLCGYQTDHERRTYDLRIHIQIVLLVQPILVYMSKVDGKFLFSPVSVNFLTEVVKVFFAICMLLWQVCAFV